MKILKNRNYKIFLIAIIIVLIFFLCAIDSKAQEQLFYPISYDFQNDVLYDKDGSFEPNMYNIREQSEYNGNYIAKYSFENELGLSGEDIGFVDLSAVYDGACEIVSLWNGHNKVLRLLDDITAGEDPIIFHNIIQSKSGEQEFWIGSNDVSEEWGFSMYNTGVSFDMCRVRIIGGRFQHMSSAGTFIETGVDVVNNKFYHIRIVWRADDTWDLFISGVKRVDDETMKDSQEEGVNSFYLRGKGDSTDYCYLDALDCSQDYGFYQNRNLIPIKEYTNQYEVDKYEFDYNYESFESDIYSWIQNEYDDTTNDVEIDVAGTQSINKHINISTPSQTNSYQNGIEFNDNSNKYIFNITAHIKFDIIDEWCATIFYVFSQNISSDYPIAIKFNQNNNKVSVYDIITKSYDFIGTFYVDVDYYINIYLNYYDDILIYKVNTIKQMYPLDNGVEWDGLYGLDKIQINNSMSSMGTLSDFKVYNVGIYENGKYFQSIWDNKEFGLMIYEIDDTWDSLNHSLITLNSQNDYKLYVSLVYVEFDNGILLRSRAIQSEREIINTYDYGYPDFSYILPCLVFMLFDDFLIPYEVEIEGVSLIDNNGIRTHGLHIYDNTYPNRYFFYCIDNKLYYNFSNSYKLGIETMTIVFDVKDVLLDDSFLFAYESYISDDYNGLITLESYGFYESFSISNDVKPIKSVYNVSLEQEFTLTEIRIHIKTDIYDFASGYTSGYIQNLNLYYDAPLTPDYDPISVLELDFLEAMIFIVIRLIFFLIPSLIFRTKFGNKSILPMWLLIGLILFISGLIPFWLFFIQIIAIGSMLMLNRSREVD